MSIKTCPVNHVIDKIQNEKDYSAFHEQKPKFELRIHEIFRADLGKGETLNFVINCDSNNKVYIFGNIYEKDSLRKFGGFFGVCEFPVKIVISDLIFILERRGKRINAVVKRGYQKNLDSILSTQEKLQEYIDYNGLQKIECERL